MEIDLREAPGNWIPIVASLFSDVTGCQCLWEPMLACLSWRQELRGRESLARMLMMSRAMHEQLDQHGWEQPNVAGD